MKIIILCFGYIFILLVILCLFASVKRGKTPEMTFKEDEAQMKYLSERRKRKRN